MYVRFKFLCEQQEIQE